MSEGKTSQHPIQVLTAFPSSAIDGLRALRDRLIAQCPLYGFETQLAAKLVKQSLGSHRSLGSSILLTETLRNINRRVKHPPLKQWPHCGSRVRETTRERAGYTEDLPQVTPEVTEDTSPQHWCPGCHKYVEPVVNEAMPNGTFGHRLVVLSAQGDLLRTFGFPEATEAHDRMQAWAEGNFNGDGLPEVAGFLWRHAPMGYDAILINPRTGERLLTFAWLWVSPDLTMYKHHGLFQPSFSWNNCAPAYYCGTSHTGLQMPPSPELSLTHTATVFLRSKRTAEAIGISKGVRQSSGSSYRCSPAKRPFTQTIDQRPVALHPRPYSFLTPSAPMVVPFSPAPMFGLSGWGRKSLCSASTYFGSAKIEC